MRSCQSSAVAATGEPGRGHFMSAGGASGGREFLPFWEITSYQWVLDIIQRGYFIKLMHIPPFMGVWSTRSPTLGADVLSGEVADLL